MKLTGRLEALWLRRDPELQGQIAWTYIGTMGGVMRIYPGVEMARSFDPTKYEASRPSVHDWNWVFFAVSAVLMLTTCICV